MILKLDMLQTMTLAILVYYLGNLIKNRVKILDKFCIPSPVIGGLIFAILNLILKESNLLEISLDTTLQKPFMMVFFTTIGLTASVKLIKKGGKHVIAFFFVSLMLIFSQDLIGIGIAKLMNANPLLGLICGSVTMVGGHGTGAAFGALFEKSYNFAGATTAAMAAATFGLITGSLLGGPVGRKLIVKNNLEHSIHEIELIHENKEESLSYEGIFKTLFIIMISISIGSILEHYLSKLGLTFPSYITTMVIASLILNVGESTNKLEINEKCADLLGRIGLNIFLSMALINLKLWELSQLALPLIVILVAQAIIMFVFAYFIAFRLCGRDYDAAVISSGFCGFGMGATPNGMANMEALVEKFGPAPRAFFVLPIVGAFFIDFANSVVITLILNFFK
ncbi:sodium/glutamate symporter [Hathewaya histolytica]|uniref:Sodium/glutamate symporter n=1 Tax=Hathewaya histolytica TaxID=1498 RepID=A0A4U9RC21_HATHI|nr:sodium/glutamate symporter [Hathewaya histolytica]VTQ89285.1 sodium/glutamate symporter [Hathewaya histolytica]